MSTASNSGRLRARRCQAALAAALLAGCGGEGRTMQGPTMPRSGEAPGQPSSSGSSGERSGEAVEPLSQQSAPLCALIGPHARAPGIYGTDLGRTVASSAQPDAPLWVLFGDTWTEAGDACRFPPSGQSDDLLARLPARPPERLASIPAEPRSSSREAPPPQCGLLEYELADPDDATSWPRVRLYARRDAKGAPAGELAMGMLRTPVATFRAAGDVYAVFHRNEGAACQGTAQCPAGMHCSSELPDVQVGACEPPVELPHDFAPTYCRQDDECSLGSCQLGGRGLCLTLSPFELKAEGGTAVPPWYRQDPRRGLARVMYIARMADDRPGDFVVVDRFVTNRFANVAVRSVTHFDADDPEQNDYNKGDHTLLMWGRSTFATTGGAQALPFLLAQRLPRAGEPLRWQPRFFAGYTQAGAPRWSEHESEAQPIYGTQAEVTQDGGSQPRIEWAEPEFDYVNQMSLTWLAPFQRWLMLYGGDVPAFLIRDVDSGEVPEPVHPQPSPGAIHMRLAHHPWGGRGASGWSAPEPVLTRAQAAPFLACPADEDVAQRLMPGCLTEGDPHGPLDLLATLGGFTTELTPEAFLEVTQQCLQGEVAMGVQSAASGDPVGRLYAANIIDAWTERTTKQERPGVELYWNVSTWNPYQVVLVKTRLRQPDGD